MPLPHFGENWDPKPIGDSIDKPELPNFVKSLKDLNIMQVRQLEEGVDRAVISFMGAGNNRFAQPRPLTGNETQNTEVVRTEEIILQDSEDVTDVNVIYNEFNRIIKNLDMDFFELKVNTNMGDIDIKSLVMSAIYKSIIGMVGQNFYIMTNYRLLCFLNNNLENKFRKFYKKETSFDFIVNDDIGDEIIIGSNENTNGPVFYFFNKELTKSKLYLVPTTDKYFKKLLLNRTNEDTVDEMMDELITNEESQQDEIDYDNLNEQQPTNNKPDYFNSSDDIDAFLDELDEPDVNEVESSIERPFPYTLEESECITTISVDGINSGFNLMEIMDSIFRRVMTIVCNKSPYNVVTNTKLGAFISEQRSFALTNVGGIVNNGDLQKIKLGTSMGFNFLIDPRMPFTDDIILLMDNEENIIHTIVINDENNDLI